MNDEFKQRVILESGPPTCGSCMHYRAHRKKCCHPVLKERLKDTFIRDWDDCSGCEYYEDKFNYHDISMRGEK
jgi:hypothetical protein